MLSTKNSIHRARLLRGTALALVGAAACVPPVFAQSQQMETIVVTGSRLQSRGFDAPTPVAVLDSTEIALSGTVNVEQLLSDSPQFQGAREGTAASNTIQANGAAGAAYTNLHGLGVGRTLVLVNSRRYVVQGTSLSTDLNTIPSSLIERTEVLTGGSSAVYGSDAVAGVMNFILKQDFEGVTASANTSFDQHTTTPTYNATLTVGSNFSGKRGNVVFALDFLDRGGFTQADHGGWSAVQYKNGCVTKDTFSPNGAGTPLAGANTGADCVAKGGMNGLIVGGSTNIPNGAFNGITTYANADATLKGLYTAAGLNGMTSDGFTFDDAGKTVRNRDANKDLYNLIADNNMQMPQRRWMMNTFAHYEFSPKLVGYSEFHFSQNTVSAQLTPAGGGGNMLFDTNNPYLSPQMRSALAYLDSQESASTVPAGFDSYPNKAGDGRVLIKTARRLIENGNRANSAKRAAWRFAGGFRGFLGNIGSADYLHDFAYDVYYTYTRTDETDSQSGAISKSSFQKAVLSQNGAAPLCDIFGLNMSKDCINAITVGSTVVTQAEMHNAVATLSGSLFDLPAGSVDVVVGGEWRYYYAQYTPDKYVASGDISGLNTSSGTKGSETVHEAFGEVRIPILKDLPFISKFSLSGAFRYSSYNTPGGKGVTTWSGGADWRVNDDFNMRTQFQHAIRAPNVGELYGGTATNTTGMTDPCGAKNTADRTDAIKAACIATGVKAADVFTGAIQGPNDFISYVSGGNVFLTPEKADTFTLGAVATPHYLPGFAMSVDYYRIYVADAIGSYGGGIGGVLNSCYYAKTPEAGSQYCAMIKRNQYGTLNSEGYVLTGNANLSASKTQGVDFDSQYVFDIDFGLFGETSNINTNTSWQWNLKGGGVGDQTDATGWIDNAGTYGNDEPLPRWKGVTRVTWQDGPLTLSLRYRYIDSVRQFNYVNNLHQGKTDSLANYTRGEIPAMHYFDLSGTYKLDEAVKFYAGINNLFDKDPPILGDYASYDNSYPATYDIYGRTFKFGITYKTN
jgi:outer membrane receptor protein involved in Fe transport